MAKRYEISRNFARGIQATQERVRGLSHSPQGVRLRQSYSTSDRKSTVFAVTREEIACRQQVPLTDPGFLTAGEVQVLYVQDDGSAHRSGEILQAFNLLDRPLGNPEFVSIIRDWMTGRWLIVAAIGAAEDIYFKATGSFGTGSATFPAQLIAHFDGLDPRPLRWSQSGVDNVINPATGGSHFFAGVSGVYGFAKWHDVEPFTSALPAGYWCYQLQCAVA